MAARVAGAWGRGLALLLLVTVTLPGALGAAGLRHRYDCGVEGLQLLVLPPEGRSVRFKVMGECQLTGDPALAAGAAGVPSLPRTPLPPPTTQGGWSRLVSWSPRQPLATVQGGGGRPPVGTRGRWASPLSPPLGRPGCGSSSS